MTESLDLVLASANPRKAAEMEAILQDVLGDRVRVQPRPADLADVIEDAVDLVGNARLKAVAVRHATGVASVADDTGLHVDALDGAPGVRSARYAGESADDAANVDKLLGELASVSDDASRAARFRTAIVVSFPDGTELVAHGVAEGHISWDRRGAGGFGYDPVFVPADGDGRTFAEMTAEEKHRISHRGRAIAELARMLCDHRSDHRPDDGG